MALRLFGEKVSMILSLKDIKITLTVFLISNIYVFLYFQV